MQGVITEPVAHLHPTPAIDAAILPSHTLTQAGRLGIYHGMYRMRMIEALETDFPATASFMGASAFARLVLGYIEQFPSRSYTLNRLGDRLSGYIAASRIRRKTFLADLTRYELAMTEVFDEAEVPLLDPQALQDLPADGLADVRIAIIPALRIVSARYAVSEFFESWRNGSICAPRRERCNVVVYRRDYSVMRFDIQDDACSFLQSLREGLTLGAIFERFSTLFGRMPSQAELFDWFRDWAAAGLFRG